MNAEKQYKKSYSNLVQSKQGCRLGFVDNRPEAIVQRRVIQKLTALAYVPAHQRPGTDQIAAVRHARVPFRGWEKTVAAARSGYAGAFLPGNCNHHVPYAMIRDGIENRLCHSPNITAAVAWAVGACPLICNNIPLPNIPNIGTPAAPIYDEGVLNSEIDDMIANIANSPHNLFYWPLHLTNAAQIDEPVGQGPIPVDHLRTKLRNYQQKLRNQNVI